MDEGAKEFVPYKRRRGQDAKIIAKFEKCDDDELDSTMSLAEIRSKLETRKVELISKSAMPLTAYPNGTIASKLFCSHRAGSDLHTCPQADLNRFGVTADEAQKAQADHAKRLAGRLLQKKVQKK
jgi:hypothetical protein